jgi:hypothetical protein
MKTLNEVENENIKTLGEFENIGLSIEEQIELLAAIIFDQLLIQSNANRK